MEEIKLVQIPVIEHKLKEAGQKVSERLAALNLDKQVATIDTVKSLKSLRADLNKELKDFELQRKAIKEGVNNPYNTFEEIYKTEISEKYKGVIDGLKTKIATVEDQVKEEKEANLKVYFIELCQSEDIDFVTFDKLNIEVNLSTSEKKYKEQINEFIQRICSDVDLIKSEKYEAEIMTEYKKSLNASQAITTVRERKEADEKEKEKIKIRELARRKKEFARIDMEYDEMTKTFVYNENILISADKVRDISKEDFNKVFVEFEEKIKEAKERQKAAVDRQKAKAKKEENKEPETVKEREATQIYRQNELVKLGLRFDGESFIYEDINFHHTDLLCMTSPQFRKALEGAKERMNQLKSEKETKQPEPLKAPIVEEKEEIVKATFEVRATYKNLMRLKAFLVDNNFNYENI